MAVPISQALRVASYVMGKRLKGEKHYALVLMLEPLFKCNLACAGCGKIQYPKEILDRRVTPAQAFQAAEECGAPVVSIAGGEPLIHPEIKEMVEGLTARQRYVYLCTNALLLERKLDLFTPSKFLSFSIHMDGLREEHDRSVCRGGTYEVAVRAIKEALRRGFRVTTNTTLFNDAQPERVRQFFDAMTELGVEGMMISPGYPYAKAPEQEIFLERNRTKRLFKEIFSRIDARWKFNHSPSFLSFLQGEKGFDYDCTPWGNPTYNVFGWQKPCYLLGDGYVQSFRELIETTDWSRYGQKGTDERCKDCMVHCGYEASAVNDTFGSIPGFARTVRSHFALKNRAGQSTPSAAVQSDPVAQPTVPAGEGHDHHAIGGVNGHCGKNGAGLEKELVGSTQSAGKERTMASTH